MKNIIKRLFSLTATAVMSVCFGCVVGFASGSCDLQISPKNAGVGEKINVTIEFSTENMDIDSAKAVVEYNPEIIEIAVDSSVQGSGGSVELSGVAGDAPVVKFDLAFVAKKKGSTNLSVKNTSIFNASGENLGSPTAEKTVNIGSESGLEADSKLKALEVSVGQLSPAFSPDVTSYTVNVDNDVTAVEISAQMSSVKSLIEFSGGFSDISGVEGTSPKIYIGEVKPNEGDNVKRIKITSENGEETTYTINIVRLPEGEIVPILPENTVTSADSKEESPESSMNIFQPSTSTSDKAAGTDKNPKDDDIFEKIFPVIIVAVFVIAALLIGIVAFARVQDYKEKKKKSRRTAHKPQSSEAHQPPRSKQSQQTPSSKTVKATVKKRKPKNSDFRRPK